MEHTRHDQIEPYFTREGSTIREWAGPGDAAEARNQSTEHLQRRSAEHEDTMLLEGDDG